MKNQPLFSILVANYNNGKYFTDCYNSLINQTFSDWECIIVDDKSTDNSIIIIDSLISNDKRFKLFRNVENKGVGYTKNKCIENSKGKFCVFVDPDDAIDYKALDIFNKIIIDNPNHSIYYSNFIYCDENLNPKNVRKTFQLSSYDKKFFNFNGIISHLAIFSKDYYIQTEGLNINLKRAIDQDLYLKLYDVSEGKVFYLDADLYFYRIHSNGISTNQNGDKAFFWHWVAIIDTCKRRQINPENLFFEQFINKQNYLKEIRKIELIKKSRLLKFLNKIGLFEAFKYL